MSASHRMLMLLLFTLGIQNTWGENGPQDHAGGFFLRLSGGAGYARTSLSSGGNELEFSGGAGDLNIAIGGIVSPDLALHGTLFGWTVSDPTISLNGTSGTASGDLTLSGFGAGVTYYFMPVNIYLSGTIGLGRLRADGGGTSGESDLGPVFDLTAGKEWWVGEGWGLGVAVALGLHSVPEKDIDENWSGPSFAVRFTATMN